MDDKAYVTALKSEPIPSELAFPREEYEARLQRLYAEMDARKLDALILADPGNLFYTTGYYTFETSLHGCALLPRKGAPVIQVASLEVGVAVLKTWIDDVVGYDWSKSGDIVQQLVGFIKDRKLSTKRIGIEALLTGFRIQHLRDLEAALPRARFVDASDILYKARIVKSPAEIDCHRKAADYTWAGIQAGLAAIQPGKTDNDVAAASYAAMVRAGSEFMSIQPIVSSGHRHGWAHTHFLRVPLKMGDTVFLEFGGVHKRYCSPMMRTAIIGKPNDQVRRVADALKESVERIIGAARPGRTCHEVAVEAKKGLAKVETEAFHSGVYGYTVGAQFPPSWVEGSAFFAEGDETVLKPGMVFHLPTCFRVPNRFGVGLSETLLVTDGACEALTRKDRDLHMVAV
ncbi:MAG: Xaa-Pro peptidase family protein [Alphaproteobacteria bacterium]